MKKIIIIGSGAIATAVGDVIAEKNQDDITLLSVEPEVVEMINNQHTNVLYFPKWESGRYRLCPCDLKVMTLAT